MNGIIGALSYDKTEYEIFNLGNHRVVTLTNLVEEIETAIGRKASLDRLPMQAGDVDQTCANIEKAGQLLAYHPETPFEQGLRTFVQWVKR